MANMSLKEQAEGQLASTHLMQQSQSQFSVPWRESDSTGLLITPSPPHRISFQEEAQSHWNSITAPTYPAYAFQEPDATTPAISATKAPVFLPTDDFTSSNFADTMMAQNILDNQPFDFEPAIFNIPSPASEPMPTSLDTIPQKL
jgi:hypothetical protein